VYNVLEAVGQFEPLVVNAQHMKAVPGRKTDTHDAAWIADLLRHGLLRASFIPPRPLRELRDLTRSRRELIHDRVRLIDRYTSSWKMPTSSSPWSRPISWAYRAGPSSRP
jgi:transposase